MGWKIRIRSPFRWLLRPGALGGCSTTAPGYVADDEEASTAVTRSANVHFAESGVS